MHTHLLASVLTHSRYSEKNKFKQFISQVNPYVLSLSGEGSKIEASLAATIATLYSVPSQKHGCSHTAFNLAASMLSQLINPVPPLCWSTLAHTKAFRN